MPTTQNQTQNQPQNQPQSQPQNQTQNQAPAPQQASTTPSPQAITNVLQGNANIAVGLTLEASDTRKFSIDVSALTKVTCEMVSVPPPRQLMALADKWAGIEAKK